MSWLGKILGGGLGFVMGGPIGAVLGAVAGHHMFDGGQMGSGGGLFSSLENKQSVYFVATFSMLAKLTKADGVVTQQEIDIIERVMRDNLRLNDQARQFAIEVFNAAKESPEPFESFARQFYQEFRHHPQVLASVIDLLLLVGHADGHLHREEEQMILSAVDIFGLRDQYQQLKSRFSGMSDDIDKYYAILGASPDEDFKEIKKKYRKLAMQHHPDRMKAEGVPPEMASAAEDRFKEIQHAFDVVEKDQAGKR